jgi:RHS repeat-associated protein
MAPLRLLLLLLIALTPLGFCVEADSNETSGNSTTTGCIWPNNQRLDLSYDAAGTLLRREKKSSIGTLEETRDYIGGIEYLQLGVSSKTLESIHHPEGRIRFIGSTQEWQYALADHLGNTRVMYADLNNNGIPEVPSEIIQEEHYYPFGMKMTGPWMGATAGAKSAYQYNGIEHLDAFDLDVNMALYRTLDPVVGRWWSVDPKGEYLTGLSPYNAMNNSPAVYNDPDGDIAPLIWAAIAVGGAAFNVYQNRDQIFQGGQVNWGKLGAAAAIGAGAAVVGTLAAPATAVGGTLAATVSSFAVSGAIGGAVGGGIQGFGNGAVFGTSDDWVNDAISGGFQGAVMGGLVGGALGGAFGLGAHWFSRAYGGGNIVKNQSGVADDVDFGVTLDDPVAVSAPKPRIQPHQLSSRTIDEAVNQAMSNPLKVNHLFHAKHNLDPLVRQLGGQRNTLRAVLNAANGRLPASGVFNNLSLNVNGYNVILRGNMINGFPRIGTMFIP